MLKFTLLSAEERQSVLRKLALFLNNLSDEQVCLDVWDCGTYACAAGWIARDEELSSLFKIRRRGDGTLTHVGDYVDQVYSSNILDHSDISVQLFSTVRPSENAAVTHKRIALTRIACVSLMLQQKLVWFYPSQVNKYYLDNKEEVNQWIDELAVDTCKITISAPT